MKRRIISVVMIVSMCMLCACSGNSATSGNSPDTQSATTQSETTQSAETQNSETMETVSAAVTEKNTGTDEDTILITDHADNQVKVPRDIKKIAVADIYPLPSVLAVFFNSADMIVGMPQASMTAAENGLLGKLYPEILNAETGFITDSEINTEELMKLQPDVVFYSASNPKQGTQLKDAGFCAVAISVNKWDYDCIETLNQWISLLSQMFPENDKAQIVSDYSKKIYDRIQTKVSTLSDDEKKKVFFLFKYTDSSIFTSGEHFFGNWWAESAGALNTAEEIKTDNAVQVNMEQIYEWNPQIIFITNFNTSLPQDLYDNSVGSFDWSGIDAVRDKQVYKMPLGMYRSYTPGADTPVTLLWIAKTVYPDLFEDVDIRKETKDYYRAVFGVELTDEEADSIFSPSVEAGVGF